MAQADVPHSAIVDAETFDAVHAIKRDRGHIKPAFRRKPKHMLSGLLRCGSCGGGMSVRGAFGLEHHAVSGTIDSLGNGSDLARHLVSAAHAVIQERGCIRTFAEILKDSA